MASAIGMPLALEVIYQRALAIEMKLTGIEFSREFEMPIFYRDEQIGTRRVDFLVQDSVSVELKALIALNRSIWHKR